MATARAKTSSNNPRQAKIDKALKSMSERPEFPAAWMERYMDKLELLARALFTIDLEIQCINELLHKAQGVRKGKISIRFLRRKETDGARRDCTPFVVEWMGSAALYRRLPKTTRLTRHRPKMDFNRRTTRLLFNQLQTLLDRREAICECALAFGRSADKFSMGSDKIVAISRARLLEAEKYLERDFTIAT